MFASFYCKCIEFPVSKEVVQLKQNITKYNINISISVFG